MPPGVDAPQSVYLDDKVMSSAMTAFTQCETYIKRKLIKGTYKERYDRVGEEISLMTSPVISVTNVKFRYPATTPPTFYTLVLNEDYYVERGIIYINNSNLMTNIASLELGPFWTVVPFVLEVEYVGGYNTATADSGLFSGLVAQTVANFHRKETLGLATVRDNGGGSVQQIANSDSVVTSARDSWASLIYYGSGEYL